MEREERMEANDDLRGSISVFNVEFTPPHSLYYILHHSNPPHKRTIGIILSLIVRIILLHIKASVQTQVQAILILSQERLRQTPRRAAARSKGMHASERCLAGNTRVPVKEDGIGWAN